MGAKEYKGIIPEGLGIEATLPNIRLHHLLANKNCIMYSINLVCGTSGETCTTCLLVHPSWRSTIDNDMRDSLVEYLVDNNYLSKADAFQYTLRS